MRKFIALKKDVYYSIEQDGDQTRFFAHKKGISYNTKKDVTPSVLPNKLVINEIIERPTVGSPMSEKLERFVTELETDFEANQ